MQNRNVGRNGQVSSAQCSQQGTLSNTILTHQTVPPAERHGQGRVGQDSFAANGHVDALDFDVLALGLITPQLQRIHGHVELLIRLGLVGLIQQARGFVFDILHHLSILLGLDFPLGLFQLLLVDSGFDFSGVGRLQVHRAPGESERRRYVPLRTHLNGMVQPPGGGGHLPRLAVETIGGAKGGNEPVDEIPDRSCVLIRQIARRRQQQRRDGLGRLGQWRLTACIGFGAVRLRGVGQVTLSLHDAVGSA